MKLRSKTLIILCLFVGVAFINSSCKTKEGCPNTEKYAVKTDRDGNMTTKKGKSDLWSKKQKKRMGK